MCWDEHAIWLVCGNEEGRGVTVATICMSLSGHPMWKCALLKFVEASDWAVWVQERLLEVDFVPNGIGCGDWGPAILWWCLGLSQLLVGQVQCPGRAVWWCVGPVYSALHACEACGGPGGWQGWCNRRDELSWNFAYGSCRITVSYLIHGCVEHRSLGGVLKRDSKHCSHLWIVHQITVMTPKVSGLLSWVMTMSMIRMGLPLSLGCTGSVSPLCLSMVRLNHVSFEQSNHMCV